MCQSNALNCVSWLTIFCKYGAAYSSSMTGGWRSRRAGRAPLAANPSPSRSPSGRKYSCDSKGRWQLAHTSGSQAAAPIAHLLPSDVTGRNKWARQRVWLCQTNARPIKLGQTRFTLTSALFPYCPFAATAGVCSVPPWSPSTPPCPAPGSHPGWVGGFRGSCSRPVFCNSKPQPGSAWWSQPVDSKSSGPQGLPPTLLPSLAWPSATGTPQAARTPACASPALPGGCGGGTLGLPGLRVPLTPRIGWSSCSSARQPALRLRGKRQASLSSACYSPSASPEAFIQLRWP